jgi:hypothetical protein
MESSYSWTDDEAATQAAADRLRQLGLDVRYRVSRGEHPELTFRMRDEGRVKRALGLTRW